MFGVLVSEAEEGYYRCLACGARVGFGHAYLISYVDGRPSCCSKCTGPWQAAGVAPSMILTKEDGTEEVSSGDAIASFLFDLIRDHVPFGVVEKILEDIEVTKLRNGGQTPRSVFADPNLGKYICGLTDRLYRLSGWGETPEGYRLVPIEAKRVP